VLRSLQPVSTSSPVIWSVPERRRLRRASVARGALSAALTLCAGAAHAHSSAQGVGDFYAGFLHPLTAPEHILPFFALGILAGQQAPRGQLALPLFWVALMAGAALALALPDVAWVGFVNILSSLVLGGLIALNLRIPLVLLLALAAAFGICHGIANGSAMADTIRAYLYIPGVGLAALVATGYGLVFTDWLLRRKAAWIPIAVRVAGSWIAAIGMLVLATSWKALTAA
jgi:urease accessory protein